MALFRANLVTQGFPFNFKELTGATIIPQGGDMHQQAGAEAVAVDASQAYFMQNVMPTTRGYGSVHYTQAVSHHTYPVYMDDIFQLRDGSGNVALFSPAKGKCLIYSKDTGIWDAYPIPDYPTDAVVTVAYLRGTTYVCFAGIGLYVYDHNAHTFTQATTTGILFSAVKGVLASSGYLVLYTHDTIVYSNPLDPLDFVPVPGGAGSSGVLANRGEFVTCLTVADGFLAYTTHNAVAARYTNNPNVPFAYNEVPQSAGVASPRHVAYQGTAGNQLAWTSAGFMLLGQKQAQFVWPELSDSLANGLYTRLGADGQPELKSCTKLDVKLSALGGRYYTVSVRDSLSPAGEFPLAYIYDLALDRWGRLDIKHVAFFEYSAPEFIADLTYNDLGDLTYDDLGERTYDRLVQRIEDKTAQFGTTLGCVQALGAVYIALSPLVANLDLLESSSSGAATPCIMFGRYRIKRPDAVFLSAVKLNGLGADLSPDVRVTAHSSDGAAISATTLVSTTGYPNQYFGRSTGAYASIKISGKLQLTLLEFELGPAGSNTLPRRSYSQSAVPSNVVTVEGIPVTVGGEYVTAG